jgi:methylthioribose-1-phosphate isomerase
MRTLRTIQWDRGKVQMIDQRRLPFELVLVETDDYREVAEAIRNMTLRGAPAIGAAAAFGMALAARQSPASQTGDLVADLEEAARVLLATRPTAVNLAWAVERMLHQAKSAQVPEVEKLRNLLAAEAQRIADEDVETNRRMGACGAQLIKDGDRILTHCNAGALATVDFGTALGVVRAAHDQGKRIHVMVDETRPRLQGARLTAWEMMQEGIPMTLIADNASGHFMLRGQVDLVLVGADRIAANGDVANKIGTYNVAILAHAHGIPFYVVAPTSTVDLRLATGDDIPIEERDAEEVTVVDDRRIAPEEVAVANPAFDVTPSRYVAGIVTESGIVRPPFQEDLKEVVEESRREAGVYS